MPRDSLDRPAGGDDPESERWRRERSGRRSRRGDSLGRRGARSLLTFLAVLVVAAGAVSLTESGWQQAREASFAEGAHLDGTTVQGSNGRYSFLATHRGGTQPVTYRPCRRIEVQINPGGEVPGGSRLVLEAIAHVSALTGLELVYSGPINERPDDWTERVTGGGLETYPPVLISWSDEEESPGLRGDVVGQGGSISLRGGGQGPEHYMTGSVTLDGPDLEDIHGQRDGEAKVRAVILHELGHLVGLGHVADPRELMSRSNTGQLDFGPGDREGLARLGGQDC